MGSQSASAVAVSSWKIDPVHSVAEFCVRHMMISNTRGQFNGVSGSLTYDENDPAQSQVEATIDAAIIDTRNPERDTHLKGPDFLDVDRFPALSFRSSGAHRRADGTLTVSGPLTLHGVTQEVEFSVGAPTPPVRDP